MNSQTENLDKAEAAKKRECQKLGLLTFDLDDTLYPIAPVVDEANGKKKSFIYVAVLDVLSHLVWIFLFY